MFMAISWVNDPNNQPTTTPRYGELLIRKRLGERRVDEDLIDVMADALACYNERGDTSVEVNWDNIANRHTSPALINAVQADGLSLLGQTDQCQ